jgi:hypothetical protein
MYTVSAVRAWRGAPVNQGRVRLRVDFNAIGPVVVVEPIDGAAVIEDEVEGLPEAGYELADKLPSLEVGPVWWRERTRGARQTRSGHPARPTAAR